MLWLTSSRSFGEWRSRSWAESDAPAELEACGLWLPRSAGSRPGPDRLLAERYRRSRCQGGTALGIRGIDIVEVSESRARDAQRRVIEEAVALASIIPDGAT